MPHSLYQHRIHCGHYASRANGQRHNVSITLGECELTPEDLWRVARAANDPFAAVRIHIADQARERIVAAAGCVAWLMEDYRPVYGINTGVGNFASVIITRDQIEALQKNLIRSHCCGVGAPLPRSIVMAMWLIRLNTICLGYSGPRLETVDQIVRMLEAGMLAVVPSRGSVGALGDLAPSAHAALALLGEGSCTVPSGDGFDELSARDALARSGLEPWTLGPKEGLSLINGTQLTAALATCVWHDARQLLDVANAAAAMSIESLHGSLEPLAEQTIRLHRHVGTQYCGKAIRDWVAGPSEVREIHAKVRWSQAPYSLRLRAACARRRLAGDCHE